MNVLCYIKHKWIEIFPARLEIFGFNETNKNNKYFKCNRCGKMKIVEEL